MEWSRPEQRAARGWLWHAAGVRTTVDERDHDAPGTPRSRSNGDGEDESAPSAAPPPSPQRGPGSGGPGSQIRRYVHKPAAPRARRPDPVRPPERDE